VGAGAAVAAQKLVSPKQESQAIINDAASRLGVQPSALSDALKAAFKARIDAAVADGRLTKDRGDKLKARIDSGDVPFFGGGFGRGPHHGHGLFIRLDAAATYLGVSKADLRASLRDGKTLAQVAKDKDKSVDGLVAAMVTAAKNRLAEAVAAGKLTDAQRDAIEQTLEQRTRDLVNAAPPALRRHGPRGGESFDFRFRRPASSVF
jgi:hypothetical protein